jgi:hypothetical protein
LNTHATRTPAREKDLLHLFHHNPRRHGGLP